MNMLKLIKKCSDAEANRQLQHNRWSVSLQELDAFIALLYARGAFGAKNLPIHRLWSNTWGISFFCDTMSRNRFKKILRFIRFDMKFSRSQRLQTDKFALASEVWRSFIENSIILCYKPGENVTVDEQLFPRKTRCRCTQYNANKPDKFGIKFLLLADVDSKYLLNGFPYLGKNEHRPNSQPLSEYVVLRSMAPYRDKVRNARTDNFFTSCKLT